MELSDGTILGQKPVVRSYKTTSKEDLIKSNFYKKEYVEDCYNELTLSLKGNFNLQFRAYSQGENRRTTPI